VNIFNILKGKRRRYPIVRDSRGKSLRQRCFSSFNKGKRPMDVTKELKMKTSTVLTYHRDWKKIGLDFEKRLDYMKSLLKPGTPQRDQILEGMASACKVSKDEMENILARPHGLRRLMTGKTRLPGHFGPQRKLKSVLDVAVFINDCLSENGMTFEDVRFAFETLMKENKEYRQVEDDEIKEDNLRIEVTRTVLDAAAESDHEGRPRRDRLTNEERAAVIRIAMETKEKQQLKNLEIDYWIGIARVMDEGKLTMEQAEEKIVEDLIDKGDMKGADIMCRYQDFIHNRKSANQVNRPPSA
jgi:hypothetical protein